MHDMTPTQIDRRLTELAGLSLNKTITREEEAEIYRLTNERRRRLVNLPQVPKLPYRYRHLSY
jgi:hypothetical protein